MPRDASGNYTLPATNPVVDGTIIDVNWANPTLSDIAAQLNNVYTRDGLLGPTGPFKIIDGTVAAPGLAFASQPNLGIFRGAPSFFGFADSGVRVAAVDSRTANSGAFLLHPRTNGESKFVAYANPATSGDLTNLTAGAANLGSGFFSFAANGIAYKPMAFNATDFIWTAVNAGQNFTMTFNATNAGRLLAPKIGLQEDIIWTQDAINVIQAYSVNWGWVWSKSSADMYWGNNGATAFYFRTNNDAQKGGGAATWTIISDRKAKQDICDYSRGLAELLTVRPRTYRYRDHPEVQRAGIIADEMADAFPETIGYDEKSGMQTFSMDPVIWALVNATKELHARVTSLETNP